MPIPMPSLLEKRFSNGDSRAQDDSIPEFPKRAKTGLVVIGAQRRALKRTIELQ